MSASQPSPKLGVRKEHLYLADQIITRKVSATAEFEKGAAVMAPVALMANMKHLQPGDSAQFLVAVTDVDGTTPRVAVINTSDKAYMSAAHNLRSVVKEYANMSISPKTGQTPIGSRQWTQMTQNHAS